MSWWLSPALSVALSAPRLMPAVEASVEAGHDLGLDSQVRGLVEFRVRPTVVSGDDWRLMVDAGLVTWFRENRADETVVRLSPEQVGYPVAARLRFRTRDDGEWGLFAFHRSNHDVDVPDPLLVRETIAYEVYGAEWLPTFWPLRIGGGLYWDRGTTRALERQSLPFRHMLAGVEVEARWPLHPHLELGTRNELIALRAQDHEPAYLDLDLTLEVSAPFRGELGQVRPWLRLRRIENYQWLEQPARTVLMLGLTLESTAGRPYAPKTTSNTGTTDVTTAPETSPSSATSPPP